MALKQLAAHVLARLGAPALLRSLSSQNGIVLCYHNVVPAGDPPGGDRSLHLPLADFVRQLDLLLDSHTVVELRDLVCGVAAESPEPLAAITFDDAYRGALTVGLEELRRRELPCTVFVSPGLLGTGSFWWDELSDARADGLTSSLREEALTRAKGRREDVLAWGEEKGLERRPQPEHAEAVDENTIAGIANQRGVTLGSHGWSHANLPALDASELREELERPLTWLRDRFGKRVLTWLSLPYGRSSARVERAALKCGYEGVLDLSGALVDRGPVGSVIPRVNIPAGMSPERFQLRVSGI